MRIAHDELGHKGYFPVRAHVRERYFWHDMDTDIRWYLRTCHQCQIRLLGHQRIPQTVPFVPGLFFKCHIDVMLMSAVSEGKKAIAQGRWATTSYPEWRSFAKHGIRHIKISAYNSRANGLVERKHFDVRESLMKACGKEPNKWASKAHAVFWAERVTAKRHLGMSPYRMVHGCEPVLPLDFEQATWLVPPMQPPMSTEELIATRARQIEKRDEDIEAMRERVTQFRAKAAERMLRSYRGLKAPESVTPGTLVLVKNSRIELEHNRKPKPRWLGPFIVLRRHSGGSYILAELDSSVLVDRVAAARVRLYHARADVRYNVKQIVENAPKYVWERANAPQAVDDEEEVEDEEGEPPREESQA
ncbi:hypothetical protein AURDEDRAFT_68242 [Auricularia subglabra TFB-10046 SS5]|nr:hypothetical protein AURDEDRAFT_68242 [Auricularia subglabra TFB-10046 SS5]